MYIQISDRLGQAPEPPAALPLPKPRGLTYSARDVIDHRISVPAQHSLVRLSKKRTTNADAVGMLEEIKANRLAGIYCVNWEKVAQRALRFGKSWWTVIPPGEDAILMLDPDNPDGGQPLIAFRRELDPRDKYGCGKLKTDKTLTPFPARLDEALLKAWASYRFWRASQQPDHLVKCSIKPAVNEPVLAGPQIYGLSSAKPLSNVLPHLFCQVSQLRCQTGFQDAEGDLKKHTWLPFPDYKFNTLSFTGLSVLSTNGRGFQRLAADLMHGVKPHDQGSHGKLLFAKTNSLRIPTLWAVFVPNGLSLNEPIPVHVFFSPVPRRDMLAQDYPYKGAWKGHVDNYLVNKGKKLLHQHAASGKRCIFVFPVVRPGIIYGDLTDAKKLRRYLLEMLCWLRHHLDPSGPVKEPTIGHCAVSAFSSGGPSALYPIMDSSLRGGFPELAEAYCLDTAKLAANVPLIKRWWANGKRIVRIYRDFNNLPNMHGMFTQKPVRDAGAEEYQANNATCIYTPRPFWDTVFTEDVCTPQNVANKPKFLLTSAYCQSYDYWNVKDRPHQLMPCVFLQHALKNSRFPNI